MASISKLSVRGIRSFSPTDSEQVISFTHPVTVIVGANGCGKTTIIESLKYAITGSLPPGNKSGQAFIHDPKSVGQSVVKGCIKLRFQNRAGGSMVVVRSMELTQKKTTLSFKQLDGILRTTDPNTGERVSMSHKCTELDRQIPALIGVGKSVLEHVVFCHQEDSSWPLMEGAVLKKRFDEIFDSTRYTKALEEIRKTRIKYVNRGKEEKAELEGLASHKFAAEGFRRELEDCEDQLSEMAREMEGHDEELQTVDGQIIGYEEVLSEVKEMKERVVEKEGDVARQRSVCEHVRSMLDRDLTAECSEAQLKTMLSSFDETVRDDKKKLERKEEEFESMKRDIERLNGVIRDLYRHKDKLEGDKEHNESLKGQRLEIIRRTAQDYDLPLPGGMAARNSIDSSICPSTQQDLLLDDDEANLELAPHDVAAYLSSLNSASTKIETQLNSLRHNIQKQEDDIQSQIVEIKSKQTSIENEQRRVNAENRSKRQELGNLTSLSQSISGGGGSARVRQSEVEEAQNRAKQAAEEHERLQKSQRLNDIPTEMKEYERQVDKLKRQIEDDTEALGELRRNEGEQREVSLLQDQVRAEKGRLEDVIKESSFLWQKYNVGASSSVQGDLASLEKVVEEVRDKVSDVSARLDSAKSDKAAKQSAVTEKKALLDHSQATLQSNQSRLNYLQNDNNGGLRKIRRVITGIQNNERAVKGTTNVKSDHHPQELLKYLDEKISDMLTEDDSPHSISRTVKQLKTLTLVRNSSGKVTDVICPCCRRSMDDNEAATFSKSIDELADVAQSPLILDPEQARKAKQQKQQHELWRNLLSNSMNDYLTFHRLTQETHELENRIAEQNEELALAHNDLDICASQAQELNLEHDEVQALLNDCLKMYDDAGKISEKQSRIAHLQRHLSVVAPSTDGRGVKQLEEDLNDRRDEKDRIQELIATLGKEMAKLNNRIGEAGRFRGDMERVARQKAERYKKDQEITEKKKELNERILHLVNEERKLQDQISPLRQQIISKQGEIQRLRSSAKSQDESLASTLHKLRSDTQSINTLNDQIHQFLQSNKLRDLEDATHKIQDKEQRRIDKETTMKEMEPELEEMRSQGLESERRKKSIENNLHLLSSLKAVRALERELEQMIEQASNVAGAEEARQGYDTAQTRRKDILHFKARCEGRIAGLKDQRKLLRRKLRTQEYNDIEERHRVKMIEYETSKIVCSDLDKYHKALDKALLRYHGMKIEDINKIVRELWMLCYKGGDITSIHLVSGQDSGSRATRSYNYRVVMTKGNTPLDMRGRCSAGQRVLASIVIRLALAETFCLNCGVMALDEPTTNLDYENKRGLAIALAQIIASRAGVQHNFQLVVITHDEDFVSMLKNELSGQGGAGDRVSFSMPEKFYQVSRVEARDGKHYSKIDAVDWDEL
mmetsp:Transcript_5721/g.7155  ORF Transcript_5721/g.7155 Transcript_5721/m.7155 type:complete len:1412 (-) Transcript_5721:70-4305(-)|eukprot:CAMPEP_0172516490 /NCGR_PEP_ID=MMETSP1066-20121228/276672_1 /TAXON_ID=671091 /ORGANISM="Coscinodiscus wailesii, Strain CCMP2513" /LENGTH=1411 /DNA_ID=CAMNT_0013297999 /DNA_START=185 /DNA_END=4420 /DNA_ORIENTATION=-